ncbi:MAG TPA: aspartyl protease family protein [Sunxiuqinia sp.]|nr:aspartyl protease family protein [Sunxiuqinia sp.]
MAKIPIELIELEQHNYHLLVQAKFEDGEKGYWIIDTGASKTVFDKSLDQYYDLIEASNDEEYQSAGISEGMVETSVGEIRSVAFGRLKLKNQKVALINLDHVNEIYRKYKDVRICGLLGSDLLKKYQCVIDYKYETISFTRPRKS